MAPIKKKSHYVRMNMEVRSDLVWWDQFLVGWNGIGILPDPDLQTVTLHTDASGSWGCAAVTGKSWFQWEWRGHANHWHIAAKELLPILLAGML